MTINKPIYFPGLNGLRAIAALSVVIFHLSFDFASFNLDPYIFGKLADGTQVGFSMAGFSVTIFFALSGFLITYLLLVEKEKGNINIKKFYVRRILRIWPLYYLFLIIFTIIIINYKLGFNFGIFLYYVFFLPDFPFVLDNIPGGALVTFHILTHYWSIGVEEKYYLFWPILVKKIKSKLSIFTISVIVVFVALKIIFHFVMMKSIIAASFNVLRFDCMLIGSLGAIYYYNKQPMFLKIAGSKIAQGIAWLIMLLLAFNAFHVASIIDHDIISIIAVILIIGQITVKNRLINLDRKIWDFLGKISYSMYVIHQVIIFFAAKLFKDIYPPVILKYIIIYTFVIGLTVLISWLSYEYFEKPFLKLKAKFTTIPSSNSRPY